MPNQFEMFIKGLDADKPDWWITFANEQELRDCVRECTDGHSGTVHARNVLRREVSERLFSVVRAAYNGGVVALPHIDKAVVHSVECPHCHWGLHPSVIEQHIREKH